MRLGIVSDTHGNLPNTHRAVEVLRQQDLDAIVHCGDVCGEEIVAQFAEWPTHFVAGNCDSESCLKEDVLKAGQQWHGLQGEFEVNGRKIAVLHGHLIGRLDAAIESQLYDAVCYGHTHRYETHTVGRTLVINPGALHRADPHTIAVLNLATMEVEHLVVECE